MARAASQPIRPLATLPAKKEAQSMNTDKCSFHDGGRPRQWKEESSSLRDQGWRGKSHAGWLGRAAVPARTNPSYAAQWARVLTSQFLLVEKDISASAA